MLQHIICFLYIFLIKCIIKLYIGFCICKLCYFSNYYFRLYSYFQSIELSPLTVVLGADSVLKRTYSFDDFYNDTIRYKTYNLRWISGTTPKDTWFVFIAIKSDSPWHVCSRNSPSHSQKDTEYLHKTSEGHVYLHNVKNMKNSIFLSNTTFVRWFILHEFLLKKVKHIHCLLHLFCYCHFLIRFTGSSGCHRLLCVWRQAVCHLREQLLKGKNTKSLQPSRQIHKKSKSLTSQIASTAMETFFQRILSYVQHGDSVSNTSYYHNKNTIMSRDLIYHMPITHISICDFLFQGIYLQGSNSTRYTTLSLGT